MNLSSNEVAKGLYDELMAVIEQYAEAVLVPTVVGFLEIVKSDVMGVAFAKAPEHIAKLMAAFLPVNCLRPQACI